jgi:soluble lytic murein transglycosylase-like protein
LRTLPIALGLLLASAAPAWAQLYSWHDAQGVLVVSDRPRPDQGEMKTFEVPKAPKVRATRRSSLPARAAAFDDVIELHSAEQNLPSDLVRAVIQAESGFNSNAVSPKGAMGLMQLMPATATEYGVTNPFHPEQNIRAGVAYLRRLMDRYDSNVSLALAAYNAGPGAVERYSGIPPYRETRDYVKKITRVTESVPQSPAPTVIYKWVDLVDGHPVTRYSNAPPEGIAYETIGRKK